MSLGGSLVTAPGSDESPPGSVGVTTGAVVELDVGSEVVGALVVGAVGPDVPVGVGVGLVLPVGPGLTGLEVVPTGPEEGEGVTVPFEGTGVVGSTLCVGGAGVPLSSPQPTRATLRANRETALTRL